MSLSVRVAPNTWWPVTTLGEASRSVRLYIDSSGIGFRAWGQESAPVRNRQGKTIARISYNSRCWTPQRDWQKRTEITGAALDVEGGPQ